MYEIILIEATREDRPVAKELPKLQRLLASLLSARMTLSVRALADLSDLASYEVSASLSRLHAVVHVPEDEDMPGLRTVHASFGDYLYSRAPNHLRIHQSLGHEALAHGCHDVMAKQLRFNISARPTSYDPNPSKRPEIITLSLEYACMQWVYHFAALINPHNLDATIGAIFRPRLLLWLEVMSALRQVWRATRMLFIAAGMVDTHADSDLAQFLRDANSFVASSYEAIELSAAHIYISALPFADKGSLVYQDFAPLCVGLITVDTFGIGQHGGSGIMTLTGHDDAVTSVSYSPDGRILASGSKDGSVRVWDTRTGEEAMLPLRSGDGKVLSVDFARNGKWIGSGTESGAVWVWNVAPDQAGRRQLSGHTAAVNSVAFSSDSSRLASVSSDKTIRLWSAATGEQLAFQTGHEAFVKGIAFSLDDEILASITNNGKFRQWDITGPLAGNRPIQPVLDPLHRFGLGSDSDSDSDSETETDSDLDFDLDSDFDSDFGLGSRLKVHSYSVDFSPDGRILARTDDTGKAVRLCHCKTEDIIASLQSETMPRSVRFLPNGQSLVAACGRAVRLWTLQPDPQHASWADLGGHGGEVNWATFSPDGLYIASASDDATIKIWSTASGQSTVKSLPAHSDRVNSVAVSHDGALIVSGSDDGSVRLWNARTAAATIPPLRGHIDWVLSVSISSDGRLIASASVDCTIRLWDTQTGAAVGEPMRKHTRCVRAVSFSNDGRWLASASDDMTVRIWDVATQRASAAGPLRCQEWVLAVIFSPDDELFAAGDNSGHVYLWLTDTGEQAHEPFTANDTGVYSLAFSPDGTKIVSGGCDNAARVSASSFLRVTQALFSLWRGLLMQASSG